MALEPAGKRVFLFPALGAQDGDEGALVCGGPCFKIGDQRDQAAELIRLAEKYVPKGQEQQSAKIIKDWHEGKAAILI